MNEFVIALATAFGVVFVAELADKTQLLALSFGARVRLPIVAIGLLLGYGTANLVAAAVGALGGARLPERALEIGGGLLFLAFAVFTLRRIGSGDGDVDDPPPAARVGARAIPSIALSIAVAEFGDKTQLATATLASQSPAVAVWIGATLGATGSGLLGALLGRAAGDRVPARAIAVASAAVFAVFGVVMLTGWL